MNDTPPAPALVVFIECDLNQAWSGVSEKNQTGRMVKPRTFICFPGGGVCDDFAANLMVGDNSGR